jgi:hypothetical protein
VQAPFIISICLEKLALVHRDHVSNFANSLKIREVVDKRGKMSQVRRLFIVASAVLAFVA